MDEATENNALEQSYWDRTKESLKSTMEAFNAEFQNIEDAMRAMTEAFQMPCLDPHHKKETLSRIGVVRWKVCPGCKYGSRVR